MTQFVVFIIFLIVVETIYSYNKMNILPKRKDDEGLYDIPDPDDIVKDSTYDNSCNIIEAIKDNKSGERFSDVLERCYPIFLMYFDVKDIGGNLIYYPKNLVDNGQKPVIFCAYQDITLSGANIVCMLQSMEELLTSETVFRKDVYFIFHTADSKNSKQEIRSWLKQNFIYAEVIVESGSFIDTDFLNNDYLLCANIGVSVRGNADLVLSIKTDSIPFSKNRSALEIMLEVCSNIERYRMELIPVVAKYFVSISKYLTFLERICLANKWIVPSLFMSVIEKRERFNNLIKHSCIFTSLNSNGENDCAPTYAEATINIKTLPGTKISTIIGYINKFVKKYDVSTKIKNCSESINIADINSNAYCILEGCLKNKFDENVVVAPYIIDKFNHFEYLDLADNVICFNPIISQNPDGHEIYNSSDIYKKYLGIGTEFYTDYIRNLCK